LWANKYNISSKKLPRDNERLMNLTSLDISNCGIRELPSSIDKLMNLSYLDVSNNNLYQLPDSIGKIEKLTQLDIGFNHISTLPQLDIQFDNFKFLKILRITGNPLNELPFSLKSSCDLSVIYTHKNQLIDMKEYMEYINEYEYDFEYNYVKKIQEENIGVFDFFKKLFS